MKILVISDTHGIVSKVGDVVEKHGGFDCIYHLGDYVRDQEMIEMMTGIEVIGVAGNCDGAARTADCSRVVETECGKIFLTHGHTLGAGWDDAAIIAEAEAEGAVAAFYGHTHRAMEDTSGKIKLICPGSISAPRDGSRGTYAVLNTDGGRFSCVLFEYDGPMQRAGEGAGRTGGYIKKKRPKGGFLRRTFNDSDGQ